MDAVRSAKSAIDDMMDNYLSELSSAKEKIDEQVDGWNRIGDVINHDVEMTKLLYGDKAYEDLNYHFEQQYDNNLKLVETQKMSMDYWGKKVKEEEALMNSYEEGSEQYKMHEKAYKEEMVEFLKHTEFNDEEYKLMLERERILGTFYMDVL